MSINIWNENNNNKQQQLDPTSPMDRFDHWNILEKYQKEWMNEINNPLQLTLEILSNIIIVLQQIHHLIVLIMTMTM